MAANIDKLHARYNAALEKLETARENVRTAKRELDQALEAQRRDAVLTSLGLAPGPRADVEAAVETQLATSELGDGEEDDGE